MDELLPCDNNHCLVYSQVRTGGTGWAGCRTGGSWVDRTGGQVDGWTGRGRPCWWMTSCHVIITSV